MKTFRAGRWFIQLRVCGRLFQFGVGPWFIQIELPFLGNWAFSPLVLLFPAIIAIVLLLALASMGATSGPDFRWLYLQQLEGYRAERDRADTLEASLTDARNEAQRLRESNAELEAAVTPLREENERLRERNQELAVLGHVESARRQIDSLRDTRSQLNEQVAALQSEKATLAASLNVLQSAEAWIQTECPVGKQCRGFPVACSGSMRPTLHCDDLPVGSAYPDSVADGDIVIYETSKTDCPFGFSYIMHRIDGITQDGYVLKGDANASVDPCIVPFEAIVARVDRVFEGAFPENVQ